MVFVQQLVYISLFPLILYFHHNRQGMKRINDFCDTFFQNVTANLLVPGGVSALNIAALHGNLDVSSLVLLSFLCCSSVSDFECKVEMLFFVRQKGIQIKFIWLNYF